MNTDNLSEQDKPEEFADEELLKEKYADLYEKMKIIESDEPEEEREYVIPSPEEKEATMKLALDCAEIGDSMRAQDIKVIDATGKTSLADFFVFMTGYNRRQIQGIASEIEKAMKVTKVPVAGIEGYDIAWWILIDLNQVIVHIFYDDARKYYELDTLWQDAPNIYMQKEDNTSENEVI
ncbi:MAG: ribosome silencing factor [Planctomycetes bacterium]|nr:ribosome silencing factor [Planctomycetota bacterium]